MVMINWLPNFVSSNWHGEEIKLAITRMIKCRIAQFINDVTVTCQAKHKQT